MTGGQTCALPISIEDIVNHDKSILVEEFIDGREISTHTISGFRGKDVYTMPVLEKISVLEKEKLSKMLIDIHNHLNIKHYLNSTFVLHSKRGFFLKHIDFFPDIKKDSHFHKTVLYIGSSPKQIVEHLIEQVL